ncbi:D-isomer specific 2-hydroxyacid dehydrogenase NAD-binding [Penicillium coprophilum]|uniref:D-isomer specific 2-hydroxyacid dehydrogenase NAD-binding n=1 Tax=Penicillium coprophilum TaxID=36646 RepID=UPI002397FD79|nr:D-isomer specific 2-hydroxyacid dehydrogenase NAD-binding [Penicillium coprophilum]KAJ5153905.1 D-isomer specific 2-hydroxyacid dehydrogenase NAD-binding [Penicillium coprophilum]
MSTAQSMDIATARHLLEQAIINLRNFINFREMIVSVGNVDPETFEELSSHIWDTKLEIARQIREFSDPRSATMLTDFFRRLIGNMPNADGVVP